MEDDPVGGMDRGVDLRRGARDFARLGAEDDLGGAFDVAVAVAAALSDLLAFEGPKIGAARFFGGFRVFLAAARRPGGDSVRHRGASTS